MRRAPIWLGGVLATLAATAAVAAAHRVVDLDPRSVPRGAGPASFVPQGNAVYFTAHDDASGRELWRTDGTPGGTPTTSSCR